MGECQSTCVSKKNTPFNDNGTRYRTHQENGFSIGMSVKIKPIR